MARIASKLNWTSDPDSAPLPSDLNRIENNNHQAFDEIDAEVAARIEDVNAEKAARIADVNAEEAARIADVNAEEAARISSINSEASTRATNDGTLQTNINNEASARASGDNAILTAMVTTGAVYSYAFLGSYTAGISLTAGQDYNNSGGALRYACWSTRSPGPITIGDAPTGVWRCMGQFNTSDAVPAISLFVRVS